MDAHDPVSLAQALIRCRSVTPEEGGALTLLENVLGAYGFDIHRMTFSEPGTPDIENLYARHGLQGPNLCFAGTRMWFRRAMKRTGRIHRLRPKSMMVCFTGVAPLT